MSVATFIPSVWSAALLQKFYDGSRVSAVTFKPDRIEGNKIIYNNVPNITINTYNGSVNWEDVSTSKVELPMDQEKYFAFAVDDVDAVQAAGPITQPCVVNASDNMSIIADKFVFAKMVSSCPNDNKITGTTLDETTAYDMLVDLNRSLNKRRVGNDNRFIIIDYDYLGYLEKDVRFTYNYNVLTNGILEGSSINGATIVVSNDLPSNTAIACHKSAFGFGMQLNETEAMRLQNKFADGVRGLQVYGGELIRPDGLSVLNFT